MATLFVRAANPVWYMPDLVGLPLNDTYYMFVLSNVFPYLPYPIYADPDHTIPLNDPIQFNPDGTLPVNMYWDPSKTYRLEVRQGNSQSDPLVRLIENYVPDPEFSTNPREVVPTANQILNPTFSTVTFDTSQPWTINMAGTYDISPEWQLVLTGTGSCVLNQVNYAADQDIVNNVTYALDILTAGWTTAYLQQTFDGSGSLWSSTDTSPAQDGIISMSATASATINPYPLTLLFSNPALTTIGTGTVGVAAFSVIDGSNKIDRQMDSSSTSVSMRISLQGSGHIQLSNIQLIAQSIPSGNDIPLPITYQQQSYEQQRNQLFNYYYNSIIMQPKDSILTGWDFGLNPWQFAHTSLTNVSVNKYTADQTIVAQQNYITNSIGNNVAVGQTVTNNFYEVVPITAHNQFALIQYIDIATMAPYWGSIISSLVSAYFATSHSTTLQFKMRLIWNTIIPASVSQNEPILSWIEGQDPIFTLGWTAIAPLNDPTYTMSSEIGNYSFNGFKLPSASSSPVVLGIVIYTVSNMNQNATPDALIFEDISLSPNDFAIKSNPLTWDETLRRCQFYAETSYPNATVIGTASDSSMQFYQNIYFDGGTNWILYPTPFAFNYNTVKRGLPTTYFYAIDGTGDSVRAGMYNGTSTLTSANNVDISNWTSLAANEKGISFVPSNASNLTNTMGISTDTFRTGVIQFNYFADSRLGR